ncbi:nadh-ubiquinone oxidoreductase subunit [Nannochloropsis oceanica]
MATPIGGPPVQDVPPPGGYPKIFYKTRLASRGPPSWAIWTGAILVCAYGFVQVGRTNTERRFWADKKREQKLALIPLLQADEDLTWIENYNKALVEEAEIMKHVPNWKVGESVYKTKVTWIPPSVSAFRGGK